MKVTYDELESVTRLAKWLTRNFHPMTSPLLAVDCRVIDTNGECVGGVMYDSNQEAYVYDPAIADD